MPASLLLLVTAPYLWRRRQSALRLAVLLLVGLALLDLLKGLDVEEAAGSLAVAGILWVGRSAFCVRPDPVSLRSAVRLVPLLAGSSLLLCAFAVWLAAPESASIAAVVRETFDSLAWQPGPIVFRGELALVDEAVGLAGLLTFAWCAYLLFRPLAVPRAYPTGEARHLARDLVRRHGVDTLAYFKLRRDQHYLFSADRPRLPRLPGRDRVLVVSGDPVGPDDALPGLLLELSAFAEARGLQLAAIGAGRAPATALGASSGCARSTWATRRSSTRTRSRSRAERFARCGSRSRGSRSRATRRACARWPTCPQASSASSSESAGAGAAPRGSAASAMALDELRRDDHGDSLVLIGHDGEGRIRAFLHFAPSYGRPAVSLSLMRRDKDTPNGLTEFLVARGIELLRDRGVEEVSLNFAAFARFIHSPRSGLERLVGRGLLLADSVFQIERLHRFNAKFFPRWEPRYLLYERVLGLGRVGLAAMWLEGQLPKPTRSRR